MLLAFSALMLTSCSILTGVMSFMACNYDIRNVANFQVSGISLANTNDINAINPASMLKLTSNILTGSLPMTATVNVGVQNPNNSAAQIGGLDWAICFNNTDIITGTTSQNIHVAPNGGSSVIPLTLQVDIMNFFKKESRDDIFKFVNGMLNLGNSDSSVSLKIRPTLTIGGQNVRTGYITLQKNI